MVTRSRVVVFSGGSLSVSFPRASRTVTFGGPMDLGLSLAITSRRAADGAPAPEPSDPTLLAEGDSITAFTDPPSYSRLYAAEHSIIGYTNTAYGGSGLGAPGDVLPTNSLYARQAGDLAGGPYTVVAVGIGSNSLGTGVNATTYATSLYDWLSPFKDDGAKTVICTVLPRAAVDETVRAAFNNKLRADVGTEFDELVDFDTTPMGATGAYSDTTYYSDGIHPNATGHAMLLREYRPVLNHLFSIANEPLDFEFAPITDADPDTSYSPGDPYVVKGFYPGETRPLLAPDGVMLNGSGPVTSGVVENGDEVLPLNQSSADEATSTEADVTIGTTTATFTVTTSGGSVLWTPAALGSKLAGWWSPEGLTGADEDPITSWPEQRGSGDDLIGTGASAGMPLVATSAVNGLPAALFDASAQNAWFTMPSGYKTAVAARTATATFYLAKKVNDPDYSYYCGPVGGYGSTDEEFYPFGNGLLYSSYGRASRINAYGSGHPALNAWHFGSFQSSASLWRHFINGLQQHEDTSNSVSMGSNPRIGFSNGAAFNGHVAEIVDLNALPTTTERQQIEGYLAWKYGLEINLPSGHPYKDGPPMT